MSFGDILKKGKKQFEIKEQRGFWGRCEYCDQRKLLFPYKEPANNSSWNLCDVCSDLFVKEEI